MKVRARGVPHVVTSAVSAAGTPSFSGASGFVVDENGSAGRADSIGNHRRGLPSERSSRRNRPRQQGDLSAYPLSLVSDAVWPAARSGQGRAAFARRSEPLTARTAGRASTTRERGERLPGATPSTTNPEFPEKKTTRRRRSVLAVSYPPPKVQFLLSSIS